MAALALLYGLVSRHGIWYPINFLASGFSPAPEVTEQTAVFHWDALIIASTVYLVGSLLVALLYVVTLPLCPRRPVLWGGLIAPILWSGLIHSFLGTVNPALNQRSAMAALRHLSGWIRSGRRRFCFNARADAACAIWSGSAVACWYHMRSVSNATCNAIGRPGIRFGKTSLNIKH